MPVSMCLLSENMITHQGSCYISELPLTILGTSSDPAYLHDTLPRSTLVKLRLENFSLPCDRQVFEHLIEEVRN